VKLAVQCGAIFRDFLRSSDAWRDTGPSTLEILHREQGAAVRAREHVVALTVGPPRVGGRPPHRASRSVIRGRQRKGRCYRLAGRFFASLGRPACSPDAGLVPSGKMLLLVRVRRADEITNGIAIGVHDHADHLVEIVDALADDTGSRSIATGRNQ